MQSYNVWFYKGRDVIAGGSVCAQSLDIAVEKAALLCHVNYYDAVKIQRKD